MQSSSDSEDFNESAAYCDVSPQHLSREEINEIIGGSGGPTAPTPENLRGAQEVDMRRRGLQKMFAFVLILH